MHKCSGNPEHTVRPFKVVQQEAKASGVIAGP
jgi:hypothetical protein